MKPHTGVQQKSHCTCRKGVITGDSSSISVLDELRLLERYESYTPPFVHAYHVVRAPLFLHATPIIPELCPLLMYPYYARNYAGILCTGLVTEQWSRDYYIHVPDINQQFVAQLLDIICDGAKNTNIAIS